MDKFHVQNYIDMVGKESGISANDYAYNESVRRTRKNYTTKIHVLERPSKGIDLHLERPSSQVLKAVNRKRSRILTIPRPEEKTEVLDALITSMEVERRSSHTDLSKLLKNSRKPHPALTASDLRDIQRNDSNHDEVMSTHIKKMKEGIERLQEITQRFNCTESYKEDVEYLVKNVKKAISKSETRSQRKD
ncbi:uncharacterized protein LOC123319844 isoform X2 [Coccinella septempunctata]|uniref:uncharacterized protein LOC123319844 isoform X2 n=1 Tax=Coccinella septempunctata TaxID=41139 RepID=UPI001D0667F3|nr:uncharacterized protein LOC123319844 isoform X2 [Coccinella septempunctata]